jgi:hypothetical protein
MGYTYRNPLARKTCKACGSTELDKKKGTAKYWCNSCGVLDKPNRNVVYGDRFGIGEHQLEQGGVWPVWLCDLRLVFEAGHWPERSLKNLRKESYRRDSCRVCSM